MTAEKKPAGKWHAVLRDDGKRYVSVTAAAQSVAAAKSTISAACRDGSMVGGHYFSYEEDGRRYACTCKICGRISAAQPRTPSTALRSAGTRAGEGFPRPAGTATESAPVLAMSRRTRKSIRT